MRNNGDYRVCCHSNVSHSQGILKGGDGNALTAHSAEITDARNSPLLKEIRAAMLRGERHPVCRRCNAEDDSGVRSRRRYENDYWASSFSLAEAAAATNAEGEIRTAGVPLGHLDLRFGNLCNLKCRMCGPTDSSSWYAEHLETVGPSYRDGSRDHTLVRREGRVQIAGERAYDWHEDERFWAQLEKNLGGVKKIYLVGGEPLLIERHFALLRKLVEEKRAPEITLEYNSNVTRVPPEALVLWRHFREVKIGASVDGYGKINDYIRHPSRWAVIERSLELLDGAEAPLRVWLAVTVQAYNIFYLTDFLKWKIEKGFRRINAGPKAPFVTPHLLHHPRYFNIRVLPETVKRMIEEKFTLFEREWYAPYLERSGQSPHEVAYLRQAMSHLLTSYRTYLRQEDWSELLPEFWAATQRMDAYRGESFSAVMPEIAEPIRDELRRRGHRFKDKTAHPERVGLASPPST